MSGAADNQGRLTRIRQTFSTGKSRPYEWRCAQINLLERLIRDNGRMTQIMLKKRTTQSILPANSVLLLTKSRKSVRRWPKTLDAVNLRRLF